jgi:aminoglycoside phosphotransferase family enzyme/predicted kinase
MPDPQQEVIAFLSTPDAYGLRDGRVERIDTHISVVFLAGRRAYKLKRAVTFPYLDYSTLEQRRAACERELRLNRRTAPSIYRAVVAVSSEHDGSLVLGGSGTPIEWLVEMRRFDDDRLLDRLADEGQLRLDLAHTLGGTIAAFHDHAAPRREYGGEAGIRRVVDGNRDEMIADGSGTLDRASCLTLHERATAALERHAVLLDARRVHGLVRQCHGDLHLRNVFLDDGVPRLFDAIEFNDDFACVDVMYDLAFLLMDLVHRNLPAHANAVLNGYLEARPDYGGLAALPLFLSCRAAVRAKVSVAQSTVQQDDEARAALRATARAYLDLSGHLLQTSRPSLTAIGGLSGSGKSTLALSLAPEIPPAPGAIVLRSDVIRKRLFGVDVHERLPASAYDAEAAAKVYGRMLHSAEACLRAGHSVVLDAVFIDPRHRNAAERVAIACAAPFLGIWLDVPYRVAAGRLHARPPDASDADVAVLQKQTRMDPGPVRWVRLEGAGDAASIAASARRHVRPPVARGNGEPAV